MQKVLWRFRWQTSAPIVPGAIIFDLANGGEKNWGATPPYRALAARTSPEELSRKLAQDGHGPAVFQRIIPSLEDIFIAQVRKAEKQ